MALTGTDRGTGTHNSSATSFTVTPGSNFTAEAWAVLCVAVDNAHSGGTAMTITVTDTKGNAWTVRQHPLVDPGAASAGAEGIMATAAVGAAPLTTSDTITVSFGSDAPTAKAWTLMQVTAATGFSMSYVTGNIGTSGTGTTSPTITTSSITLADMVIGMVTVECGTTQVFTGDADATSGSWSTQQTTSIGSTTSGMGITSQRKVVTGTAAQTYNPTLSILGDLALAWIQLTEVRRDIPVLKLPYMPRFIVQ